MHKKRPQTSKTAPGKAARGGPRVMRKIYYHTAGAGLVPARVPCAQTHSREFIILLSSAAIFFPCESGPSFSGAARMIAVPYAASMNSFKAASKSGEGVGRHACQRLCRPPRSCRRSHRSFTAPRVLRRSESFAGTHAHGSPDPQIPGFKSRPPSLVRLLFHPNA